jgi:F-type H+-transporting ATPase subunit delta
MQGASRAALARSLASFETSYANDPGPAAGEISEGLYAVAGLLDREPSLRRAFTDPASSPGSRQRLVEALLGSQLPPLPLRVLRELVADRWNAPDDLREVVERLAATAALTAAEGSGKLDDVEDELFRFERLLQREPALRAALTDPGLPAERKGALLRSLLEGRAQDASVRLLEIAMTRRRGKSLEAAIGELLDLAAARRSRYVAQVRVARPLAADQETRLQSSLTRIYGREVSLQVDVDPTVLGGLEVRIGDEVIDGTVSRRLHDVRRSLAG